MLEKIKREFVGRISFPLTNWLYNRKNINRDFKQLIRSELYPDDQLKEIQLKKVRAIIAYANEWIPFYKKRFKEAGLNAHNIVSLEDLKKISPLTRQEVIDNRHDMIDMRLKNSVRYVDGMQRNPGEPLMFARFKKNRLIRNTSSGSTGSPTVFYEDGSITAASWANEMRLRKWFGINPGEKEARLVRFSTEYVANDRNILFRKLLWNQLILPGVNLKDSDYDLLHDQLKDFKPKVLWGFTSALTGLAEHLLSKFTTDGIFKPELIITWAAPLYEHERNILSKTFRCAITNIYGMRETGHIAALCPEGRLHINQENYYVESDDSDPEIPELIVTPLMNTPMPFIRYRTGDLGTIKNIRCECGKKLQVIDEFLGRTGEVHMTGTGRMISPNFWCRTFMEKNLAQCIRRFQIRYKKNGMIEIAIVKNAKYDFETEDRLKKFLLKNLTSEVQFYLNYIDEIEPLVSGKYLMVVKE